jgi:hypothetical protein
MNIIYREIVAMSTTIAKKQKGARPVLIPGWAIAGGARISRRWGGVTAVVALDSRRQKF